MPTIDTNPIKKGVENLFSLITLNTAKAFKTAFIDITPPILKLQRGVTVIIPELWEVNLNEKKSLCDWIVENGTSADFSNFNLIFDFLSEIIQDV